MVAEVRPRVRAPIVIFSYANPILRMGLDAFVARARRPGWTAC
jgi:tryptophan synthase alpha subunit